MDWNKDKSVKLSQCCVAAFMVLLAAVCVLAPWLFGLLIRLRGWEGQGRLPLFLVSTYCTAVPAAVTLWGLRLLLRNIGAGAVFIAENTAILRRISWCCLLAGLVYLASALYYMPFLILSAAAGFVGLLLRVVKNAFAEAVSLKDENDYTI